MEMIMLKLILILVSLLGVSMGANGETKYATFAGGCFWCMEPPFEKLAGVISVEPGYMGGKVKDPSYTQVSSGGTGHAEVVQIKYDPKAITYKRLLEVFFENHDPTDANGQFVDRGDQYRSAIFYYDKDQKDQAIQIIKILNEKRIFRQNIITSLEKASDFTQAEEYHRDYYKKNPVRYHFYRYRSGRDEFLKSVWDKRANLNGLTPMQFEVTQRNGTEPPFKNEYWDNKRQGVYVDIVSNEVLFSSEDKYDSKTGWPSFTRVFDEKNVVEVIDRSIFGTRIEVRSKKGNSHLGHVFDDGPPPTNKRYCINSAALRFIAKEDLQKEGFLGIMD